MSLALSSGATTHVDFRYECPEAEFRVVIPYEAWAPSDKAATLEPSTQTGRKARPVRHCAQTEVSR